MYEKQTFRTINRKRVHRELWKLNLRSSFMKNWFWERILWKIDSEKVFMKNYYRESWPSVSETPVFKATGGILPPVYVHRWLFATGVRTPMAKCHRWQFCRQSNLLTTVSIFPKIKKCVFSQTYFFFNQLILPPKKLRGVQ